MTTMSTHVLDRPVWRSLSTHHGSSAVGGERARRFAADIGPLAGARDDEDASLAALAELIPPDGTLLLLRAEPISLPDNVVAITRAVGVQMVAEELANLSSGSSEVGAVRLGPEDVPSMIALAAATKPGPFATRTAALGEFWGVRMEGVVVAMAGERLRHDGFTEVSGVCTHPNVRGRGLARALSALVATRILARGDTPYLHAYATNTAAIALYESLGFRLRREVHVATIARE